jgi:HK97 family phage portal protein
MAFLDQLFGRSERRSLENPSVSLSDASSWSALFGDAGLAAGQSVTPETAMGVPAIFAAINIISGTIASLPLHLLKDDGEKATRDPLYRVLHDVVNADGLTSYAWRKWLVTTLLLTGRAFSFIEKNKAGRVTNIWPLETHRVTVAKVNGRKVYRYRDDKAEHVYAASEIIDLIWQYGRNDITHIDPLAANRETIGQMIAVTKHASNYFAAGAVPPLVLTGPLMGADAASRASANMEEAIKGAQGKRNIIVTPKGYDLKPVGLEPGKSQLLETRQWLISEVERIWNIPASFLHDNEHATFSNIEHQDIAFSKHTIVPLVTLIESELNAKLFVNWVNAIKFNVTALERGDYATRTAGYVAMRNAGILTANDVLALENLPPKPGGDKLLIQGAMIPVEQAGQAPTPTPTPEPQEKGIEDEGTQDDD